MGDSLTSSAQSDPTRHAAVFGERVVTFAELEESANRAANSLGASGFGAGDRVLWCTANSLDAWVAVHAFRKAGLVSVPVSYRATAHELRHMVSSASGALVITDVERAQLVLDACRGLDCVRSIWVQGMGEPIAGTSSWTQQVAGASTAPPQLTALGSGAVMMFTSGTTGLPKAALRSALAPSAASDLLAALRYRRGDEVHLVAGPLYHAGPLRYSTLAQSIGATVVVMSRFDPVEWTRVVERHQVTSTFLSPTMLKRVLTALDDRSATSDLSSLRSLLISGGPCPFSVKQRAVEKLGEVLYESYGATELGTNTLLLPTEQLHKPGSSGRPVPGNELRVLGPDSTVLDAGAIGKVYVRSPMVVDGYVSPDDRLDEVDGFVSVGDVGYLDDEGYLFLVDREADTINTGGVNVYPAEIEAALHAHAMVVDVAVFGIPSDEWGEMVHAVVQLVPGAVLDRADLELHARRVLSGYKVPRSWEFRDELPRTESGKLRKQELRQSYWPSGVVSAITRN